MTLRAIWSGVIGWGLVTVPVKLGRATADDSIPMHQVHTDDGGRIKYRKFCEICGNEIPQDKIGKGAQLATGETVMLTPDDMDSLPQSERKRADVLYFCSAAEIDPVAMRSSYYLWPAAGGERAYQLMYEALAEVDKVAVCQITIRARESLAVIMPRNDALMLVTLFWPGEVREPDFLPALEGVAQPKEAERKMAASLIEVATRAFAPDEHQDGYSGAVRALVDSRGGTGVPAGSGTAAGVDLMDALKESLGAAREARKAQPRKTRARAKAGAA